MARPGIIEPEIDEQGRPPIVEPDISAPVATKERPPIVEPESIKLPNSQSYLDFAQQSGIDEQKAKVYEDATINKIAFGINTEETMRSKTGIDLALSHNPQAMQKKADGRALYEGMSTIGSYAYYQPKAPRAQAARRLTRDEIIGFAQKFKDEGRILESELQEHMERPYPGDTFLNTFGVYTDEDIPSPSAFFVKTFGERAGEVLPSVSAGVNGSIAAAFRGVQWLQGETGINIGAKGVADWLDENAQFAMKGQRPDFMTDFWGAWGSFLPLVAGGELVGGFAKVIGLAERLALALNVSTVVTTESLMNAGQSHENILREGGTPEEAKSAARVAMVLNMPLNALTSGFGMYLARFKAIDNVIGTQKIGQRLAKAGKETIRGGVGEFGQEGTQSIIGDVAEKKPINIDKAAYEGLIAFFVGGPTGGAFSLMSTAAQKIDAIGPMPDATAQIYDNKVQEGVAAGLSGEQANIEATQEIAKTPEGREYIDKVMQAQESVIEAEAAMGTDVPAPEAKAQRETFESVADQLSREDITEDEAISLLDKVLNPLSNEEGAVTIAEEPAPARTFDEELDALFDENNVTEEQQAEFDRLLEATASPEVKAKEQADFDALVAKLFDTPEKKTAFNRAHINAEITRAFEERKPAKTLRQVIEDELASPLARADALATGRRLLSEKGEIDLNNPIALDLIRDRLQRFPKNPRQGIQDVLNIGRAVFAEGKAQVADFTARMQEIAGEAWESIKPYIQRAWDVLNNEAGQVDLFHGTPHDFDEFSLEAIGTGEGAQAFGWGLYFTDKKDIANHYAKGLSSPQFTFKGEDIEKIKFHSVPDIERLVFTEAQVERLYRSSIDDTKFTKQEVIDNISKRLETQKKHSKEKSKYDKAIKWWKENANSVLSVKPGKPTTIAVTLHKGKTPDQYDYMEWDKPVSESQRGKIVSQAKSEGIKIEVIPDPKDIKITEVDLAQIGVVSFNVTHKNGPPVNVTSRKEAESLANSGLLDNQGRIMPLLGVNAYVELRLQLGSEKEASMFLLRAGIDGIQYPAGSLSGGGEGTNFVVFDPTAITIESKEAGSIDLNAEISLAPIIERLKTFAANPEQGAKDMMTLANSVWAEGKTQVKDFMARMKEVLGDLFETLKPHAQKAWNILANERGEIGRGGKPTLGKDGQVLWANWFNSKGQLRMSDWVKAEIFGEGGAVEDNGALRFISRTTPESKGKGVVFGFDQFAQMAFDEGMIEDADVNTFLEAIRDSQYQPPRTLEERVEGELEARASEIEGEVDPFLGIQEIAEKKAKPIPGQLFGAAEFKGTMQGKIPGGSQALTEIERAAEESKIREAEARDREANVELFREERPTVVQPVPVAELIKEDVALKEGLKESMRAAAQAARVADKAGVARERVRMQDMIAEARNRQVQSAEIKRTQKRLKKLRKSKKQNIAVDYQKRINSLIDTVDLKGRPTDKTLNSLISLKDWLDTHSDKMPIPQERLDQLTRLGKLSLREMTPEDVKEINQTIKTLVQIGKLKRRLQVKYDKQRLAEVTKQFTDVVVDIDGDFDAADPTKGQIFKRGVKGAYLATMHTPRVADMQDGFNDYNGPHAEMIKDFSQRETNSNMTSQAIVKKTIDDIIAKTGLKEITEEQQVRMMIHIRLQEGAEGAAKTLMERKGYTSVPAITAQEQQFIDIIQESTNLFTDQLAATVEEIDNQIFPLADNYILPLKYEKDVQTGAPPQDSFLPGGYRTTKTQQGFKFERVQGVKKTPRTDILAIFEEAINAQQWYLNMQPAIEEARQVVLSEEYADAAGELNYDWWKEQLDIIARRGWSATAGGNKAINAALRQGRINLSQAILGYKASSILMQPFAIFDAMAYTTMRWGPQTSLEMTKEFTKAWIKPNYAKSIIERSPALQLRQAGELAVEEVLDKTKGKGFVDKFVRGGFEGLRQFDVRTAAGVREGILHILQKNGVENAEVEADFLMNMVSASADVVLRPQILSKGEGARLWFTFQSFFLNRWGLVAHDLIQGGVIKGNWKRKMTAVLGLAILMAGGMGEDEAREVIFESTTGKELPEDEAIEQIMLYVPAMIPLLGPMIEAGFSQRGSEPPLIRTGKQAIQGVAKVATGKDLEARAKGAVRLAEAGITLRFGTPGTAQFFDFAERILFEDKKAKRRR